MTSLYGIIARDSNTGVIFRRGPTRHVRLISWNLKNDTFELGQWFLGRIYEQKSDLSPNGELLAYFAAKHWRHTEKIPTWVAVSRPPYLTALVMWEGLGTWNDISLFETDSVLQLWNCHKSEPVDGFDMLKNLRVKPHGFAGFFYQLADHRRLVRDGWTVYSGDPVFNKAPRIVVYRRNIPSKGVFLQMTATGYNERLYSLHDKNEKELALLNADWADVHKTSIVFSNEGKLFRLKLEKSKKVDLNAAKEIADFTNMKFEPIKAPKWATKK